MSRAPFFQQTSEGSCYLLFFSHYTISCSRYLWERNQSKRWAREEAKENISFDFHLFLEKRVGVRREQEEAKKLVRCYLDIRY